MKLVLNNSILGILTSALLLGCGATGDQVSSEGFAVLGVDLDSPGTTIQILDMSGQVLDLIETDIIEPMGLSSRPGGDFIVTTETEVLRVTRSGDVSLFNQDLLPWPSPRRVNTQPPPLFRVAVTESGEVTVTQEYDVTEWTEDGDLVMHTFVAGNYCWMDAALVAGSDKGVALLDVFGPTIAFWNGEADTFEDLAVGIGTDDFADIANILGNDTSGNYYVASSWGNEIYKVSAEGAITALASSTADGSIYDLADVSAINAIEPAGPESVFVLVESVSEGSSILRLDASTGASTSIVTSEDGLWLDLTLLN